MIRLKTTSPDSERPAGESKVTLGFQHITCLHRSLQRTVSFTPCNSCNISLKIAESFTHAPSHSNTSPLRKTNPGHIQRDPSSALHHTGNHDARPNSISTTATLATSDQMPPSNPRPSLATLLCFSALTLSIFLVALDTVLIPTALASIALDFRIPDSLYAWTGSAYLLANAASIPFWGKLSDVVGRKPVILITNSIFLGGSVVCAVSSSATMLVAGRAFQGLGGGGVNVLVYVCVADMFAIR